MALPGSPFKYIHFHWYVTTRCNSRCQTCSIWKDPLYKSKESPINERISIIRQIKKLGFISVDFTGGEPLLYNGLSRLIREGKKLGLFTTLTTNGTLYKKYAYELKGNLAILSFSLDASDEETHDKIRGIRCYKKVVESIILARKLGENVMLKTTVCNDYMDSIPSLIRFAEKYGVLIELNPEFEYFGNPRLTDDNIKKLYKFWKHPNVIISHAHLRFMLDGGNNFMKPLCPIGTKVIVMAPDNSIYSPCFHHVDELIPLRDLDLQKTLESAEVQASLLKAGWYYFCHFCTIPCYFEALYYSKITKYFPYCYFSRLGFLKKQFILSFKRSLIDKDRNNTSKRKRVGKSKKEIT
ncbi:MAG: radical SAM protein [Promethearchaeota archaeon]